MPTATSEKKLLQLIIESGSAWQNDFVVTGLESPTGSSQVHMMVYSSANLKLYYYSTAMDGSVTSPKLVLSEDNSSGGVSSAFRESFYREAW